jgi:hypothetical protein
MFFLLLSLVSAQKLDSASVEDSNLKIESKETFYCQPVFRGEECLVRAWIDVEAKTLIDPKITLDFKDAGDFLTTTKDVNYLETIKSFKVAETKRVYFDFWTSSSGKFDVTINGLKLDPYYNVTINSSYPSYHLINGTVDVYCNDEFDDSVEVSACLSDSSDSTKYNVVRSHGFVSSVTYASFIYLDDDADYKGYVLYNDGNYTDVLNQDGLNRAMNLTFSSPVFNGTNITMNVSCNNPYTLLVTNSAGTINYASFVLQQDWGDTDFTTITLKNISGDGVNSIYFWRNGKTDIEWEYISAISSLDVGNAISVYFNHTLNVSNDYWLRIRKTTTGIANATVYTYINSTHLNTSNYMSYDITTGWDIMPINSIVPAGYNEPFRLFTELKHNISEVQLIEQIEDNESPKIFDCKVNGTNLNCSDTIRLQCNVTDNEAIDKVWFQWDDNISNFEEIDTILDSDVYYKDVTYSHYTVGTENYTFIKANATDIVSLVNNTILDLSFDYTCICPENWVAYFINLTVCYVNDTFYAIKIYNDTNECGTTTYLPIDNGTTENFSCNYCSEDIVEFETQCVDDEFTRYWIDFNYDTCCNVTQLPSDCHIDNSSYVNQTISCSSDMFCWFNSEPFIKGRLPFTRRDYVDYYCRVNLSSYSCISEVYRDDILLQTNPDFEAVKEFGVIETFESFTPLLRAWYRKGTLLPEGSFDVKTKCTDGNEVLEYTFSVEPKFKEPEFVAGGGGVYLKRNWNYVFGGLFVLLLISIVVAVVRWKR